MFEKFLKSRIKGFQLWHFQQSQNWPFFGIFNELLSTENVNVARFARNVE